MFMHRNRCTDVREEILNTKDTALRNIMEVVDVLQRQPVDSYQGVRGCSCTRQSDFPYCRCARHHHRVGGGHRVDGSCGGLCSFRHKARGKPRVHRIRVYDDTCLNCVAIATCCSLGGGAGPGGPATPCALGPACAMVLSAGYRAGLPHHVTWSHNHNVCSTNF